MSSSGLIYAVIVGAWAAYLVPMWLRRQDELNEARPTERFSTAIRLLSGRAGMERRYAKDLRARSTDEGEHSAGNPGAVTDSVDVRAFAMPPTRPQAQAKVQAPVSGRSEPAREAAREPAREVVREPARDAARESARAHAPAPERGGAPARKRAPVARRTPAAEAAAARAQRTKALARRRRTTVVLFLAFTLGAIVAAVGGLAFLWAPGVPAVLLSAYIVYLRSQERRRFAYQMDRRQAEAAAQRLRESARQPRRRASVATSADADEPDEGPEPETDPGLSALAADRRALVEQTDHAEWVDQQRERQRRPGHGDSWDPVPVPLPTYVTAPVAPRATTDVDLGAPDAWSSARSTSVAPEQEAKPVAEDGGSEEPASDAEGMPAADGRTDARRAASARRARERGRTPLFDQYEDGDRPRAANE
ncbi:gephyrin-like molybdotransferase receptor GlpR [Streptomyces fulvoviolaceus]|uniref:divisome protein SepX/GlpR n=1 Tax=Streptomyces fulvoviolaceus TaxID=285535 RepID=UPI0004C849EF|nr:gephyrin-like molybdotransferase receptor GlpR [Streptomyces fulvoviolaceus]